MGEKKQNLKRIKMKFIPKTLVYKQNATAGKYDPQWEGPYTIESIKGINVKLTNGKRTLSTNIRHIWPTRRGGRMSCTAL